MTVVDDLEDIQSICLTAVDSLLKKYEIDPRMVGRLEIGKLHRMSFVQTLFKCLISIVPLY